MIKDLILVAVLIISIQNGNNNVIMFNENLAVNEIVFDENSQDKDMRKVFESFFEFTLPDTAEILNYDYYPGDNDAEYDPHFKAKILIKKEDIDYIKNGFIKNPNSWGELKSWGLLSSYSKKYPWWDLTELNETIYAYRRFKTGMYNKTVTVCFIVAEGLNDICYLYVVQT